MLLTIKCNNTVINFIKYKEIVLTKLSIINENLGWNSVITKIIIYGERC